MRICRYLWLFVFLISPPAFAVTGLDVLLTSCSGGYDNPSTCSSYKGCSEVHPNTSFRGFCHSADTSVGDTKQMTARICPTSYPYGTVYGGEGWFAIDCLSSCPSGTEPDGSGKCVTPPKCGENEREWNGECRPKCEPMQAVPQDSQTGDCECGLISTPHPPPSVGGSGNAPGSTCYGGCSYQLGGMTLNLGGKEWIGELGTPLNQVCSSTGESEKPLPETKEPPCAPGEGVGTSSSGKVLCVPEGTPNAPKPDVEKTVKKETYPDGSEKTTETTKTKDPTSGATDTKSTSTSTGGMAGPAGTTTTTETSTGDGKGTGNEPGQGDGDGDGDCEGDDCGGGKRFEGPDGDLYEKKDRTMKDALDDFRSTVRNSPVIVAAHNWFTVSGMPSACGGLTVTVPFLDVTISVDPIFCGEYGVLIMQIAGAVVLAMAAYAGFRMAFYG